MKLGEQKREKGHVVLCSAMWTFDSHVAALPDLFAGKRRLIFLVCTGDPNPTGSHTFSSGTQSSAVVRHLAADAHT